VTAHVSNLALKKEERIHSTAASDRIQLSTENASFVSSIGFGEFEYHG
jgi:hypothetical protein